MAVTLEGPNPGTFRWSLVVSEARADVDLASALGEALARIDDDGRVQLWVREVDDEAHALVTGRGFQAYRDLWQLRCPLPAGASGLVTRGVTPADLDDFVAVNNRAFRWHPEQGGLTRAQVEQTMTEPWFTPEGFRLLHDGDELIGFCWTKIHRDVDPALGEIYVIAVDPSRHGQGLGKPMTLAGLEWLAGQGLTTGMLYVESDNDAANATYAALGFTHHQTDRAYELDRP